MVAGGRIGVLHDAELVNQLQIYQIRWRDIEESQNLTYRLCRNHATSVGQKFGLSIFSSLPEKDFITLIRDNPELEGALRTLAELSLIHYWQMVECQKIIHPLMPVLKDRKR